MKPPVLPCALPGTVPYLTLPHPTSPFTLINITLILYPYHYLPLTHLVTWVSHLRSHTETITLLYLQ